jgi:hypothetical protein
VIATRTKIELASGILAAALCIYGLHEARAEHEARAAAEATAKSAQAQIADAQRQRDALVAADRERNAETQQKIAVLEKSAAQAKTPEQIVKWLPRQLPPLPAPFEITLPPATPQNLTPPAEVSIPQADLVPLRELTLKAQACEAELPAAQSGLSSCQQQLKMAGEQLSAAEHQRDAYKTALQGGTFWQRIKSRAKEALFIAGGTAAVMCGTGHCK